ncbi:Na+/H+ exchanger [Kipferlia bialata]|uniref:Sodium/hydrogen exchanger n=1 Tax=Kipferlia bialata TaxID=797122 RepID=A0A9K3GI27_9EUKA|nr:Na+/H+ exchanger [Kipferlia bialata]|eukprot:g4229.t1
MTPSSSLYPTLCTLFLSLISVDKIPNDALLLILIPPIILHGGYDLDKRVFFRNIGTILFLAFGGTLLAFVITGLGLYYSCQIPSVGVDLPMRESLSFGALVSASDPVVTLALFSNMSVDPTLYMLVFGESTLNDAVAVVLCHTFSDFDPDEFGVTTALWLLVQVASIFIGSVVIGVVVGLVAARLFVSTPLHTQPNLEIVMTLPFAYLTYYLAEGLSCSGIMAILTTAFVLSHYVSPSLTVHSRQALKEIIHALSFVCEAVIFMFLGLSPFAYAMVFSPVFIAISMGLIIGARIAVVYGLSSIANLWRRERIPASDMFVMFWGGLKGPISFGLALAFELEYRQLILGTTVFVVVFMVVFFGGTTYPIYNYLARRGTTQAIPASSSDSTSSANNDRFKVYDEQRLIPMFRRNTGCGMLDNVDTPLLSANGSSAHF